MKTPKIYCKLPCGVFAQGSDLLPFLRPQAPLKQEPGTRSQRSRKDHANWGQDAVAQLTHPDGGNRGGRKYYCGRPNHRADRQAMWRLSFRSQGCTKRHRTHLHSKVLALHDVLEKSVHIVERSKPARLPVSNSLLESLKRCKTDLDNLNTRLDPGKRQKVMKRFGLRALKWPFTRNEVDKAVQMLEGYITTFGVALVADQMSDRSVRVGSDLC